MIALLSSCLTTATFFLIVLTSCRANSPGDVTGEIIATERASLDRWGKGDPQGLLDLYVPGITYFDPFQEKRVDGLEAMKRIYAPFAGKLKIGHSEMIDPKVQRYGDVALLTYNLVDDVVRQPDGPGNVRVPWNCTEVYVHIDGRWRIVHNHWSFIKPEPRTMQIP